MVFWIERTDRQGRVALRAEHRILGSRGRVVLVQLAQRPAGGGVERHLALLEALAVADADHTGAVAQGDVGAAQRGHLADAQAGLPTSAGPTSAGPTSARPTSAGPTSARPTSAGPTSAGPTSSGPTSAGPTSAGPTSAGLTSAGPTSAGPTSAGPTSAGPTSARPTSARPTCTKRSSPTST